MRNKTKAIIFTLLTLVLSLTALSPIYADDLGVIGDSVGGGAGAVANPLYHLNNCGYRMYIVTDTGGLFTDVTGDTVRDFLYSDRNANDETIGPVKFYHDTTIASGTSSEEFVLVPGSEISDMPPPVTASDAAANGDAFRTWMLAEVNGEANGSKIILDYFGAEAATGVKYEDCKLVVEALYWYTPKNKDGKLTWRDYSEDGTGRVGGTIHNIAAWESSNIGFISQGSADGTLDQYGGWGISLLAKTFPTALFLNQNVFETQVSQVLKTGLLTYDDILKKVMSPGQGRHEVPQGYGMHIYYKDIMAETNTTYDETKAIPAPPKPMPAMDSAYESILRPIQIIKVYETISTDRYGKTTTHLDSIKTSTPSCRDIVIENEENVVPKYDVKEWITSTSRNYPSSWNEVLTYPKVSGGSGSKAITVPSPAKYIYIHLVHTENIEVERVNLILNESEISRAYTAKQIQSWETYPTLPIKFSWGEMGGVCTEQSTTSQTIADPDNPPKEAVEEKKEVQLVEYPKGSGYMHPELVVVQKAQAATPGGTITTNTTTVCNKPYILNDDNTYTYALKNSIAPPTELIGTSGAFLPQLEPQTTGGTVSTTSAGTKEIDPDYKFIIYRGQDKPTLAEYKPTATSEITGLIGGASAVPHGNRQKNGAYNPNLSIKLTQDQPAGDYSTSTWCPAHPLQGKQTEHVLITDQTYEGQATINVHETGAKNPATAIPQDDLSPSIKVDGVTTGKIVTTVKSDYKPLEFYPYVQMTYQTTGAAASEKTPVSVLSEQISTMNISAAVAVKWQILGGNDPRYGLNIRSDQWSNHVRATNGKKGWNLRNQVLPGGALYCVDTTTKGSGKGAQVTLTGYYPTVPTDTKHITSYDPAWTSNNGEDEFQGLCNSTKEALSGMRLNTYIAPAADKKENSAINGGQKVVGGKELSGIGSKMKPNTDAKYYLKEATKSDDITDNLVNVSGGTASAKVYHFSSDISGNILMDNVVILSKKQGILDLPEGTAKTIDNNTKVVTNLVNSINRNEGNDKGAEWAKDDGKWYNEAFDGIDVTVRTCTFNLYLEPKAGTPGRMGVIDPRLCAKSDGTSDKFSKANVFQIRADTENDSTVLGEIFGGDKITIDLSNALCTRPIYIPNVSVQDLD